MNSSVSVPDTQLSTYLNVVRRRLGWFLGPAIVFPLLAAVVGSSSASSYSSTARVLISESAAQQALDGSSASASAASRTLTNEIDLAKGDDIRAAVEEQLGSLPSVAVRGSTSSDVITFTGAAETAEASALAANTWAQAYVDDKRTDAQNSIGAASESMRTQLEALRVERQEIREPINDLEDRIATTTNESRLGQLERDLLRLNQDLAPELGLVDARIQAVATSITELELSGQLAATGTARIVQEAAVPGSPTNAPVSQNLLLGLAAGLIAGLGLALLRENLDDAIQDAEDVARITALPVLGSIPRPESAKDSELALESYYDANGAIADAYHKVRTALQFAFIGRDIRSIVVTSANQSEGKTTTSTNLAWAFSSSGGSVGLVDVDFRRPRLHEVLGLGIEPGLSNYFIDNIPLDELVFRVKTQDKLRLFALPSGTSPPNPAELIAAPTFSKVVDKLNTAFELTVFDAPPVLPVSDALALARHADTSVVVIRAGHTRRQELVDTIESLNQVGSGIAGIVIVGAKASGRSGRYGRYESDEEVQPLDVEPLSVVRTESLPSTEPISKPL